MILMYHDICHKSWHKTYCVDVAHFIKQMAALKNKRVVYLDEYDPADKNQVVITFDDGRKHILTVAAPILKRFGYPFEVFVINDFMDEELYLTRQECQKIKSFGGRLQYHGRSHIDLTTISDDKSLQDEIVLPQDMRALDDTGFNWYAYPFCKTNDNILNIVKNNYRGGGVGGMKEILPENRLILNRLRMYNDTVLAGPDYIPLMVQSFILSHQIRHLKYKLLSKITFGKTRKKYKRKLKEVQ